MYVGSADFQLANAQPIQQHKISGTIDDIPFGPSDVVMGSASIKNQCSDSSDAEIGAVYIGELHITFVPSIGVEPKTWQGRVISVSFSLLTDQDPETWETFSLGVFTVASAERTLQGFEITAYDNLSKFDKEVTWDYLPSGTLYSILSDLCTDCEVTLGMTQADCEALPNGAQNIAMYPGSDVQTYRDILYWLSQMVAGFATADRQGRLVLRSYSVILGAGGSVPQLPSGKRLMGASISDYVTNFRGVTLYNMKEDENKYYGDPVGTGLVYDLGKNPFMQYGTAVTIRDMATAVADAIKYKLRPFSATIMSAPIWELGDRLQLSGGIATGYNTTTVIHAINYAHGSSTQLQCFGANPAIAQSGTQDKTASTAGNSAKLNNTSYKRYANPNTVTVSTIPEKVAEITFTAEKNTDFDVWHEILLTSALNVGSGQVEVMAVYCLDGAELTRKPVETYIDEAKHILTLNYSAAVNEGNHLWEVYLVATGGTATINTNDAIAVLKGQGLSNAETWDGIIFLTDDVANVQMLLDTAMVSETAPEITIYDLEADPPTYIKIPEIDDDVENAEMAMDVSAITENITITLYQPTFPIEAEESTSLLAPEQDGYYLQTE